MDFFRLSKLFWLFAEPGNLIVLLLVAALVLERMRKSRAAHVLVSTVTIVLVAIFLLPVDQWLARPLEDRFPEPDLPACVAGILILSGAEETRITASRDTPVAADAGKYAVVMDLMRRFPNAKVVFSGGDPNPVQSDGPQSDVGAVFFRELGVEKSRILYEDKARDTWENFVFSQRLAQPEAGAVWLLVTPALHMPRSMGVAQEVGWPMIALPTDYRTPSRSNGASLHFSLAKGLELLDEATKEWIGLVAYRLAGRSAALFPGPVDAPPPDCTKAS